jgi:hypothetical protein
LHAARIALAKRRCKGEGSRRRDHQGKYDRGEAGVRRQRAAPLASRAAPALGGERGQGVIWLPEPLQDGVEPPANEKNADDYDPGLHVRLSLARQ